MAIRCNDNSYGRHKDGLQEIGTFHGGDLKGLTTKLDYLQQLGVNALWISSPLEQIHGWVGGGTKGTFLIMPITVITPGLDPSRCQYGHRKRPPYAGG